MGESKSFKSFEQEPVLKKETASSVIRESERVVPVAELIARHESKEQGAERKSAKNFNVWFVDPVNQRNFYGRPGEMYDEIYGKRNEKEQKLAKMAYEHNVEKQKKGDTDIRSYSFKHMKSPGDIIHELEMAYDWRGKYGQMNLQDLPELIVVFGKGGEDDFVDSQQAGVTPRIREVASKFIEKYQWNSQSRMEGYIGEEIVLPFNNSFRWTKEDITPDTVLEAGVGFLEDFSDEFESLVKSAIQYQKTGDEKTLEKAFTDEYLKKIYDKISEYDEKDVDYICDDFNSEARGGEFDLLADFEDEDDYVAYRSKIANTAESLDFEKVKEKMKKYYVETLKKYLDEYRAGFEKEEDVAEWETNLIQPIIVSVSDDFAFNEYNIEHGANLALTDFEPEDMESLIQLVSRIKSSPASLSGRRLTRAKDAFYSSVEDLIEGRAETTADTEKELVILKKIFEENQVKSVLDVGCGYGRITLPLIESGYEVDGLDSNENFLEKIKQQIKEKKLSGQFEFNQESLINYANNESEKKYDSVIYTWNTILEAFGPGNLLKTLNSAWQSLNKGGVLVFDQPTRENQGMGDGWYGNSPEVEGDESYLSYIMTEDEIRFILRISGFEDVEINHWTAKETDEYPEGVQKITVSAKKPTGKGYKEHYPHLEITS